MKDALAGFSEPVQFAVVSKTVVDYKAVNSFSSVAWLTGSMQPLPAQALKVKPEGQRTWKWWKLWTDQQLKLNDEIQDKCGRRYKVMEVSDWRDSGYFEYELMEKAIPA